MTNTSPFRGRRAALLPSLPTGETIARFDTYPEAQQAVGQLAKAEFPVKELSVVGTDLATVERITGKLSWGRVALSGALTGAWFGVFLGLLFLIFAPTEPAVVIPAVLLGAGFGLTFSLVTYAINRRRRDFTSTMQVIASSYAIIGEPGSVAQARSILGVGAPATAPSTPVWSATNRPPSGAANDAATSTDPHAPAEASASTEPPAGAISYGEALDAARRARAGGGAPARPRYGALITDEQADDTAVAAEPSQQDAPDADPTDPSPGPADDAGTSPK